MWSGFMWSGFMWERGEARGVVRGRGGESDG
jgi:hypothetical protein